MSMDTFKNTNEAGDFRIEDATPEDIEAMIGIKRDRWLAIYPNEKYGITTEDLSAIDWYNPEGLAKRKKELVGSIDKHTWVLKNDKGDIVGFCKATKLGELGEINAMYTMPGFEGKGLGKKLMDKSLEWLGAVSGVKLKVVAYNTSAIGFYKKFGFQETATKIDYGGTQLPSGKEIPRIEMVKLHQA